MRKPNPTREIKKVYLFEGERRRLAQIVERIKGLNKRALEEYAIKKEVMQSANLIVNLEVNRFVFLSFII